MISNIKTEVISELIFLFHVCSRFLISGLIAVVFILVTIAIPGTCYIISLISVVTVSKRASVLNSLVSLVAVHST